MQEYLIQFEPMVITAHSKEEAELLIKQDIENGYTPEIKTIEEY